MFLLKTVITTILMICVFTTDGLTKTRKTTSSADISQIYQLIKNKDTTKEIEKSRIIEFVYDVAHPSRIDCCDTRQEADIFVLPLESLGDRRDGFLVGVASAGSGVYNIYYDFIILLRDKSGFEARKIEENILNPSYDKQHQLLISTNMGNSQGYCTRSYYYSINDFELELVRETKTDDCDKPMDNASSVKEIVVFEKNSDRSVPHPTSRQ